ncbi:hypothetical protein [Anaeromyxobacter diazotrophicus]|uniref:Uncharacterized protein n=1 Tax=Anaeromyxobacter diazotrophicus TaxID=2590199 RepID=A0A7I9VTF3_9BACT|nr:hypothetical protein [Anaeromyxobacter diazotrophicus]GEJ59399.1 hypothetical protein AMYX_41400 [Anaeromyxobacter diazotrophicus]
MTRTPGARERGGELAAWQRLEDEAAHAAAGLRAARERARVARSRAADRRERGEQARLAGQEAFAVGLLDAADAHELTARRAEVEAVELERRHGALRREADARRVRLGARGSSPVRLAPEELA